MAKWIVPISTYANGTTEVEAATAEDAARMVLDGEADFPWLCNQCAGHHKWSLELGDEWKVTGAPAQGVA